MTSQRKNARWRRIAKEFIFTAHQKKKDSEIKIFRPLEEILLSFGH